MLNHLHASFEIQMHVSVNSGNELRILDAPGTKRHAKTYNEPRCTKEIFGRQDGPKDSILD